MKAPRVPYPEREEVLQRWCTCLWVFHEAPDGPERVGIHNADPDCPLHRPGNDLPDNF